MSEEPPCLECGGTGYRETVVPPSPYTSDYASEEEYLNSRRPLIYASPCKCRIDAFCKERLAKWKGEPVSKETKVTPSSGNVFHDVGCENAERLKEEADRKANRYRRINYELCTAIDLIKLRVTLDKMESEGIISGHENYWLSKQMQSVLEIMRCLNERGRDAG